MRGWILDCFADPEQDGIITWVRTANGTERLEDRSFRPAFYAWAPADRMADLRAALRIAGIGWTEERRRTWLAEKERDVLRIVPRTYAELQPLARREGQEGRPLGGPVAVHPGEEEELRLGGVAELLPERSLGGEAELGAVSREPGGHPRPRWARGSGCRGG